MTSQATSPSRRGQQRAHHKAAGATTAGAAGAMGPCKARLRTPQAPRHSTGHDCAKRAAEPFSYVLGAAVRRLPLRHCLGQLRLALPLCWRMRGGVRRARGDGLSPLRCVAGSRGRGKQRRCVRRRAARNGSRHWRAHCICLPPSFVPYCKAQTCACAALTYSATGFNAMRLRLASPPGVSAWQSYHKKSHIMTKFCPTLQTALLI